MIHAIGIDAAFANMGLARVGINPETLAFGCSELRLVQTEAENKKQVRVSSDDLRRALELGMAIEDFIQRASTGARPAFAFVEVPSGAQDAKAARALGMATGVLAVLQTLRISIIEVAPAEVKAIVSGSRTKKASKAEIIKWASQRWPDAPWLRAERDGRVVSRTKAQRNKGEAGKVTTWKKGDLLADNEHLADALATIAAGVRTPAFTQALILSSHATTSPDRQRPSSRRIALL